MSIRGKKIAMAKHALSVAQAIFENLRTNLNNPFKLEIGLIHIRLQAEADRCALQSTPGDPTEAGVIFHDLGKGEGFLGKYGELRLDLARHLLKELSK